MGFEPADVAVLVDLVRHHLLLPSFATGRDLEDPATVAAVADAVGTEDTPRPARRAHRGRLARHRPDRVGRVEGRSGRPSRRRSRAASCADAPARRSPLGPRPPPRPAPRHVRRHAHRRTASGRGHPGGARRARSAGGRGGGAGRARAERASARTFTVDGVAIGEFDLEPERGREPDWAQRRRRPPRRAGRSGAHPRAARGARHPLPHLHRARPRPALPIPGCSSTTTPPRWPRSWRCGRPTASACSPASPTCSPAPGAGGAGLRVDPRPRGGRHLLRHHPRRCEGDRSGRRGPERESSTDPLALATPATSIPWVRLRRCPGPEPGLD